MVGSILPLVFGFLLTGSPIETATSPNVLTLHDLTRAQDDSERFRQETTLLASALLGFGPTHLAFMQGVRVEQEPQGREVATGWVRLELQLVR
jgi:hypothetical protein